jgi:PAS domain S-box-containing protein
LKVLKRFSVRHDLGIQLMLLYIIFVGLVVGMTLVFARLTRQRLEADIKAADLALARSIAQETDIEMRNALLAVRELGKTRAVLEADPIQMEELFKTVMMARPDISYIHRLNSQGFMLYHYPEGPSSYIGSDLSYYDYFQRAQITTQALISKGSISPITNQPVASAVMPLWDERAEFKGLVATNIKLESLSQTLIKIANEYQPEEEFRVLIIDSAGQIIAHPDASQLLKEMPESQSAIVNAVLQGKASNIIAPDESGRDILYSFVPISRSGWGVIVSRPTKTAFAGSESFYRDVLVILATFVIVGVLFWIGLDHQAIRPLSHLVDYSQTIGRVQKISEAQRQNLDNLSNRSDQVGNLTNSLIRMEKVIEARLNELSILLETSAYVLSSLDSQTVLNRILDQVEHLLNVGMSAIVALDERQGVFRVQASHGFPQAYIDSLAINPNEPQSATSRAIHSGIPIQVSDTETDPAFTTPRERARSAGYRSILAIPLNTQHAPPSALLIFRPDPHIFSEQEITLLSNFANQAAMAIENAALYARSDTRLQAQTRRLESLIQSLDDGLILGNLTGQILYANRSACEWANLHPEEVVGSSMDKFIDQLLTKASNADQARRAIRTAIESRGEKNAEISLLFGGEKCHLRIRIFNVTDSRNHTIGYGQIFQDITADHELDRLKSSLITTVSHELRTPLASIKGYTTTLLADDVEWDMQSQNEFLQIISDETDRLSGLVNDLLDLSRIEAGDIKVSRTECNFPELVQRAAERAQPKPGDRLRVDIPKDLPSLELDARRIEVVMRNLIENATKYADSVSPIRVSANLDNGDLIVKVEDQGPGIPLEARERIFESFYRVEDDVKQTLPGFGLGLSICQGFIKAHGGEIWTEACDTGARIVFSLPVAHTTRSNYHD